MALLELADEPAEVGVDEELAPEVDLLEAEEDPPGEEEVGLLAPEEVVGVLLPDEDDPLPPPPTLMSDAQAALADDVACAATKAASIQLTAALAAALDPEGAMAIRALAKASVSDLSCVKSPETTEATPAEVKVLAFETTAFKALTMSGMRFFTALRIEDASESDKVDVAFASLVAFWMALSRPDSAEIRAGAWAMLLNPLTAVAKDLT